MKYSILIKKCQQLIQTYNQNIMTADSHADQFLSKTKCEDTERVFFKQVFYGYERYKGFLRASNEVIFSQYTSMTNRKTDYYLFAIFTYLIVFRLDQLPFQEFKKMVMSQDMVKLNILLTFIFDFQLIREKVLPAWRNFLEDSYLQEKIFPALQQKKIKCLQLTAKVSETATGKRLEHTGGIQSMHNIEDMVKQKKKMTVVQEFNLTKPKPKALPQPQKIEIGFKANPVPRLNKDLKQIQQQKKKRREEIRNNIQTFYDEKKEDKFQFQTSKRPTNIFKLKQEAEIKIKNQTMKKTYSRPVPQFKEVEVKLNVAAILRQEKKLNEKIQQEEQRMKNLEINMRDESEFQNWQKQMKQKDKYEQLQLQQRRKIEMQLAREAAIEACSENIQQKKNLVADMKQIANELKQEREKLEQEMLLNKKKVVEQVQQIKQNILVEREKIIQKNKKIHDQEKQQRRRIQQKKKQQERVQMEKRKQLIQEIRELQKNIRGRAKTEIEYVSIGLLEEMNLDELRLRLQDVKKEQKEEQERRRRQNIEKKQSFRQTLSQKKNTIMQHRDELTKQKQEERRRKKQEIERQKERLEQVKLKSMNQYKKKESEKIRQRKLQKEKLAKEIKQTDQRRMFLMQGQAAQQNNAFMNLQKGQEREILDRQNTKLMQQYRNQTVKESQTKIIAEQGKRIVQQKIEFNKLYAQQQHLNNQVAQELQQQDQVVKAMQYHNVRTFEQKHHENMTKMNPFKTKIAEMSLSKAKTIAKN